MNRLVKSVEKSSKKIDESEKDYAYAIWLIEKEFNVGKVDEHFPVMKFWNLLNPENAERYKSKSSTTQTDNKEVITFGKR